MSPFKALLASTTIAAVAFAGAASAHPQLTDAQYFAAARCQALMTSSALGKVDSAAIDAMLKSQASSRMPAVSDRADEIRQDTLRIASRAGPNGKAALIAERDGACATLAHTAMVASAVRGQSPAR